MDTFLQENKCAKCGSVGAHFEYHGAGHLTCRLPEKPHEHMHRHCGGCGHQWAEAPLDA
jgi:hypothetical protein